MTIRTLFPNVYRTCVFGLLSLFALLLSQCAERQTNANPPPAMHRATPVGAPATAHGATPSKQSLNPTRTATVRAPTPAAKASPAGQYNPQAAALNVQLGMGYLQKGDVQRAQTKLQQAYKQSPRDVTVINALAYFYSQTGQADKAKQYYQHALKLQPQSGQAHNNYGVFLCQHDDRTIAIQHFLAATRDAQYVKSAEAFENAGLCALKLKQTGKAWQFFHYAHQRDPQRASVLLELARLAYREGKISQAKRYLDGYEKIVGPTPVSNRLSARIANNHQHPTTTG